MRLPVFKKNKENKSYFKVEKEEIFISSILYSKCDFDDEKTLPKLIKKIENIIRQSLEYKNFIKYLKQELNKNHCSFFKNIDHNKEKLDGVTIEFHHYPFTLYEIVYLVLSKMAENEDIIYVNKFEVADRVTQLHYQLKIGLVPLTKTLHELAHSGKLFINIKQVEGNVQAFIDEYKDYFTPEMKSSLETLIKLSEENDEEKTKELNEFLKAEVRRFNLQEHEKPKLLEINKEQNKKISKMIK